MNTKSYYNEADASQWTEKLKLPIACNIIKKACCTIPHVSLEQKVISHLYFRKECSLSYFYSKNLIPPSPSTVYLKMRKNTTKNPSTQKQ